MVESGLGLGAGLLPVLLPGFVAAAIGYILFIGLGDWGGLGSQSLAVPSLPDYSGTHVYDLVVAVVVGIAVAVIVATVRSSAAELARDGTRRVGLPVLLVGGGLAVGLVAQVADWLGADSQDVLFSGQTGVPALAAATSTKILLVLLVAKAIGYGISLGCGFRGAPSSPPSSSASRSPSSRTRGSTSRRRSRSPSELPPGWRPVPACSSPRCCSQGCWSGTPARTRSRRRCSPRPPPG